MGAASLTLWFHRHAKVSSHPYEEMPLGIVSGVGRSGTTVLRHALSAHREVHSTGNENNILYDVLDTARQNCTYPSRRATMHVAPPAYDRQWRLLILNLLWPEPRRGRRRPAALLACSDLTPERAEYLQRVFPGCRIVYIVRNGIAVVASRMVKRDFRDYPFEHHCRVWAGAKEMVEWGSGGRGGESSSLFVAGCQGDWGKSSSLLVANCQGDWGKSSSLFVAGCQGEGGGGRGSEVGGQGSEPTTKNQEPRTNNDQLTTSPTGGFILIRQEDLLVAGQARVTIDGVIAALGLAPDPACAEVIVKQTFHPTVVEGESASKSGDLARRQERWQLWTDEQRQMFTDICGDTMRYFGYEMPWECR